MHTKGKITICSHKHSFTPYPSLSPYSQTDRMTDRETNTLTAHGLEELFSSCAVVVSVFQFWHEICFGITYVLREQYSCGVVLVFLVLAGNSFWCYIGTYSRYNAVVRLCQFLIVSGNSSQNENTF